MTRSHQKFHPTTLFKVSGTTEAAAVVSLAVEHISSPAQSPRPSFSPEPSRSTPPSNPTSPRTKVLDEYKAIRDLEISLSPGSYVSDIEFVPGSEWWLGTNESGESGLFPASHATFEESHCSNLAPSNDWRPLLNPSNLAVTPTFTCICLALFERYDPQKTGFLPPEAFSALADVVGLDADNPCEFLLP